ncbi:craniofacial development protein 2-like [Nilaparvata lugens]|uniref:craniofacial development protein 2-like n=1 Tax=Nilaparvata lugens TaxID=108931 RepID=UPI00193D24D4|nr:craniofacial development protein 2-like [Nilaparvata lugens]
MREMDWRVATWNVRTMLAPGKMKEVTSEILRYKLDIVALQEIRWQGGGQIDKKEFSLLYSGPENRTGYGGTGFFITAEMRKKLLNFEPISERMCMIRLKGRFRNVTIISVYAPTEDADEQAKEDFYDVLTNKMDQIGQHDMVLVLGDLNAQVGRESAVRTVAGNFSLHDESNNNGFLLAQFAESNRLVIKSTSFPHKRIHLGTWKVPGSEVVNQIDHVLVSARHASGVLDVRTMRGPNCDSDHFLVRAVVRFRLANIRKERGIRRCKWDIDKLQVDDERQIFQNNWKGSLCRITWKG